MLCHEPEILASLLMRPSKKTLILFRTKPKLDTEMIADLPTLSISLINPWGLWITPQDEIWVCGCSPMAWRETDDCLSCPPKDQLFMKFDTTGRVLQLWTVPQGRDGQEQPGELNWVHAVAGDAQGNLYAGDILGRRAQKFVRRPPAAN